MSYLGLEIGGSKLQAAFGRGDGKLLHIERVIADARGGRDAIAAQIANLANLCQAKAKSEGITLNRAGIGFGGPVDPARGTVVTSHQVDGWENFPLASWLEKEIGLPVVLGNDSDLAGLAEAHHGAGKGKARVAYMNIGSGIGGAFIFDGKLYLSQGAGASEIGHLRIRPHQPGTSWQTLEDLASGWNLAHQAKRQAERNHDSLLYKLVEGELQRIKTETVITALETRDPDAVDIWLRAIEHWGIAIANVITLLRPEVFVLGGGVSLAGEILFKPLAREVAKQVFAPFANSYELVPAALGEEVVLHGALQLARDAA